MFEKRYSFGDSSWGVECFIQRILLPRQIGCKRQECGDEIVSSGHDTGILVMNSLQLCVQYKTGPVTILPCMEERIIKVHSSLKDYVKLPCVGIHVHVCVYHFFLNSIAIEKLFIF